MQYSIPRKWSDKVLEVEGLGTLRRGGFWSGETVAECADGRRLTFARAGALRTRFVAKDDVGGEVGECRRRDVWGREFDFSLGGALYDLRKSSSWKSEFRLLRSGEVVASVRHKGWGADAITMDVESASPPDAATLLFVAWVVKKLSEQTAAAASG